jgi:catechol 2,3-dioxygenase-like lactoylglutathione lyase family enzyme
VLLLFRRGATGEPFDTGGGVIPPHAGVPPTHFAFAIAAEDVEGWAAKLEAEGVAVESVVTWPRGAKSVYFRDPDRNLAERIARVSGRPTEACPPATRAPRPCTPAARRR